MALAQGTDTLRDCVGLFRLPADPLGHRRHARVRDLANERGLVALEAMWTRYLPHMRRIRSLIADGALGGAYTPASRSAWKNGA